MDLAGLIVKADLAWAIPFKVDMLGASLEAYLSLQPAMHSFRMCHRYGGSAPVTRLPSELVASVEEYMLMEKFDLLRYGWEDEFKCFENACELDDHYDEFEKDDVIDKFVEDGGTEDLYDDRVLDAIDDFWDDYMQNTSLDIHCRRRYLWKCRVSPEEVLRQGADDKGFFRTHADDIKKHFGLEVWLSHTRPSTRSPALYEERETTLAYLRLPSGRPLSLRWERHEDEIDSGADMNAGCGLRVGPYDPLSGAMKARFHRAMRILGLSPCVHEFQRDHSIWEPPQSPTQDLRDASSWPKLIILIKATMTDPCLM